MPGLSRLADRGLLWIGLAAALWATGDRQARRAAWRGLGSMAAASTAANLVGKSLTNRRRPFLDVPARSRLRRVPQSSSFPSGHAANAAAFVTGAAIEMPSLAAPGIALASAVGASRIATGVHYPSDILAGTAIGAAAGLATLWWWPRRPPQPAAAIRPPRTAPASAAGEGLALIVNTAAGTASTRLARRLAADLPEATIIETSAGEDLAARLRDAAADARILGVAGGDGTVSAAAAVAVETDLPLLVIPAGTFNHFAADLGVEGARDALAALRDGEAVAVDLALAGSRPFVNTSSTGVYVDMVNARRQLERVLGRRLAEVVALIGVLRHSRPHELVLDGRRCRLCCRELPVRAAGHGARLPSGPGRRLAGHPRRRGRRAGQVAASGRGADRYARPLPGVPLVASQIGRHPGGGRPAHLAVHRRRGGHRRIRVHPRQAPAQAGGLPEIGAITRRPCCRAACGSHPLLGRVMCPRTGAAQSEEDQKEGALMKSDTEIRDDVINELRWDPQITKPDAIGVAVTDGAVTLTGHVATYTERLAAAWAAERVYGVKAVANDLKVKLSGAPRDDTDIARAIAHVLEWNVQVPEGKVHARVQDGWVTLEGEVEYEYQRHEVERSIRQVRGVAGVTDTIAVRPPVSPERVQTMIEDAFRREAQIDARHIRVEVSDHTAKLYGHVHSLHEAAAARAAAAAAPGVATVESHLAVSP